MVELKGEITMLRRDNKKSKKLEEKLTPENQKLKTDKHLSRNSSMISTVLSNKNS
jgi:hypothetical protein